MKSFYKYVAEDLSGEERRLAVNFALRVARESDLCKEASVGSDCVSLKLLDKPEGEFAEQLNDLGFKEC